MNNRLLLCAVLSLLAVGVLVAGDDPKAVWTAHLQGIDTPEKLEAVRRAVAGNRPVRIAFANSSTSRAHGTPHDDFEQREMYAQAKYFGLPIEIIRIPPVDIVTTNRTLEVVYKEAIERGDIVCDYRSYWDDVGPDYHGAARLIAAHPEKLFILPYGEIGGAKCPPTGRSLQGMALHGDGTGLKNVVLTTPLSPKTAGKILRPSRRTPDDLATVTFVTPSGWAAGAGDTCRAASMATVLAAWIWSARGDRPSAAEIVRIMAEGRALPAVSETMNFTAEHLKTLKEQLAEAVAPDALGRRNLIYDAPLSLAGVLPLAAAPGVSRGAGRLTGIAALPVVDPGARIGYVGSIDLTGGNADWNWGDRQDGNGEWILFEDTGAGCIYNFTQHRTVRHGDVLFPVPTYRFYFDGATAPQFELTPGDFGTKAPFLDPLAGSFSPDRLTLDFRIVRSFVPMAYRKSVKVTSTVRLQGKADAGGGWGHITYHHYDSPEGLTTFDGTDGGKALQELYARPRALPHDGETAIPAAMLAAGARREIFSKEGRSTLVGTELRLNGFTPALATDLWIVFSFDGRTTVCAPVGTFFGCEMPVHEARRELALLTFDTKTESGKATLANRFPMPFFASAKIMLENRGTAAVALAGGAVRTNGALTYDPRTTGLFTASDYCPPTRNVAGKNARIGELVGRGQMVYGTVSLRNATVRGCEGDVRCYIDDMTAPRVQSDGSESWGSWGWGFCKPPQTQPFAAYDSPVSDNTSWSQVRLLIGDSYTFQMRLRFEIEHGDCNDLEGSKSSGQVFGYVISPALFDGTTSS